MYPTRRAWLVAGVGSVLIGIAVLSARVLPFLGSVGLSAWFLTCQYTAVQSFRTANEQTTASVTAAMNTVATDQEVLITANVERATPTGTSIDVTVPLPVGAQSDSSVETRSVTLEPGEQSAETTFTVSFAVAGEYTFPEPELTLTDEQGLLQETLLGEAPPAIIVEPPQPENIHVGQSGDPVFAVFGNYEADSRGGGLIPEEVRQYVPGDQVARIDWKATARLNELHVREFEAETDRQTMLLVDHRTSMSAGPRGEEMLDYAREVALGVTRAVETTGGSLGLYTVGDQGLTMEQNPGTAAGIYTQIRTTLRSLEPTQDSEETLTETRLTRPSTVRKRETKLSADDSEFASVLQPFFQTTDTYVRRFKQDALFAAVKRLQATIRGTVWTMIFTDDSRPDRVREAVRLAVQKDNHVIVFLHPAVLFQPGQLSELDTAYEQYVEFEQFRRELEQFPRATVLEVGPQDRLNAILTARRQGTQTYE